MGWVIAFSVIFLLGMFLNWYFYSRHERVDRVYAEDIPQGEIIQEEVPEETSIDKKAYEEYNMEPLPLFEIQNVDYYVRYDEVEIILKRLSELYQEIYDPTTN